MPNHFHGILFLQRRGESGIRPNNNAIKSTAIPEDEHEVRPYGTLVNTIGRVIQAFKSISTNAYILGVKHHGWPPFPGKLWQRNYYERIIRDEKELNRVREYIIYNPLKWEGDKENPRNWI